MLACKGLRSHFRAASVSTRWQMPLNLVRLALVVAAPSRSPLLFAWIWRLIQWAVCLALHTHSAVAAQPLYRRCCLPVTPAPGPGAVVIFKRSFVAAHSPSHDRLCLAVRCSVVYDTPPQCTRTLDLPLCRARSTGTPRRAPGHPATDRRTARTLVIMYN